MSRNTLAILYGTLAVLAIALGLFVANLFGTSSATPADTPNSVASASARTTVPAATSAPAATAASTNAPATAVPANPTAAPTDAPVNPTAAPTDAPVEPTAALPAATDAPVATAEPTIAATAVPAEPTAAPTAEAAFIEYTVQRGDSLKNIAQRYNTTVTAILAINDLSDPDNLTVGDVIKIPRS